ncbi:MAG: hypothetical protein Q9218_008191, partial [Villophora microphyllina]
MHLTTSLTSLIALLLLQLSLFTTSTLTPPMPAPAPASTLAPDDNTDVSGCKKGYCLANDPPGNLACVLVRGGQELD